MLAYANDLSFEDIFVEQLINYFEPGDLVIGISASGNSANVLKAIDYTSKNNGTTVGLCGFAGGELVSKVDIPILVKADDMQQIEDVHMIIAHISMQEIYHVLSR